ncbi:nascent polypeptide-associated complex subunit alpha, muscle-specific form-like [Sarcophilus harrisii]|uniref:nascent polypeptide-associated complex subunit alpha, muscle-specific form-like n=1 Tax=Sarcophilus harrisii TaxID=9305 RepID=UPI001301D7F0|nr:nascent polypeptide-associated complex subunit alpha, muscle-specific form-like [Sarcophilus harrisii]
MGAAEPAGMARHGGLESGPPRSGARERQEAAGQRHRGGRGGCGGGCGAGGAAHEAHLQQTNGGLGSRPGEGARGRRPHKASPAPPPPHARTCTRAHMGGGATLPAQQTPRQGTGTGKEPGVANPGRPLPRGCGPCPPDAAPAPRWVRALPRAPAREHAPTHALTHLRPRPAASQDPSLLCVLPVLSQVRSSGLRPPCARTETPRVTPARTRARTRGAFRRGGEARVEGVDPGRGHAAGGGAIPSGRAAGLLNPSPALPAVLDSHPDVPQAQVASPNVSPSMASDIPPSPSPRCPRLHISQHPSRPLWPWLPTTPQKDGEKLAACPSPPEENQGHQEGEGDFSRGAALDCSELPPPSLKQSLCPPAKEPEPVHPIPGGSRPSSAGSALGKPMGTAGHLSSAPFSFRD